MQTNKRIHKIFLKKSDGVLEQNSFENENKVMNEKLVKRKQRIRAISQILVATK